MFDDEAVLRNDAKLIMMASTNKERHLFVLLGISVVFNVVRQNA